MGATGEAASAGLSVRSAGLLLGLLALVMAVGVAAGASAVLGVSPWAPALAALAGAGAALVPVVLLARRVASAAMPPAANESTGAAAGTDLPLFMKLAEREWARARRYGSGAAMLIVDVDRYARLCEARSPAAGEAMLSALLMQTAPTLRPADIVTRFAEAQLAVFLAPADATGALDVAERIRERAEQLEVGLPAERQGSSSASPRLRATVSVGVAHLRPAHLSLQALVDDAADAVLAARHAGGNCVRAAPVDLTRARANGQAPWRGDDRRSRPTRPRQGGPS